MDRKRRILLAVLVIALAGGVTWLLWPAPEPVYGGKPLSYWLEGFDARDSYLTYSSSNAVPTRAGANDALLQMGTNAIPFLLRMLQAPNPSFKDRLWLFAQKQHFVKIPYAPKHLNGNAYHAFCFLGPKACSAVPQLIEMLEGNDSATVQTAVPVIFGEIGPSAAAAVPVLVKKTAHTNLVVRADAIYALGQIHAESKLVVPALIKCLSDPEAMVRAQAAWALGKFGKDAKSAIPALLDLEKTELVSAGRPVRIVKGHSTGSPWRMVTFMPSMPKSFPHPAVVRVVGAIVEAVTEINQSEMATEVGVDALWLKPAP